MNHNEMLMNLINNLLDGTLSVPEFEERYYNFYLEEVPEDALPERDSKFFGYIQEMLDWTAADPPAEDKSLGWMTYKEFIDFVARQRELYFAGKPVPELSDQ